MQKITLLLTGCVLFLVCSCSNSSYDKLIFPDPTNPIMMANAIESQDNLITGEGIDLDTGYLINLKNELQNSYHMSMIKINQCARNLSGNNQGPNLLLLSENEGGFPRQGIRLFDDTTSTDFPDLHYVDLVMSSERLERGDLSIYSHELGHVMMNNILNSYWDRFPNPTSPKQHVSMGITDYLTAFYEGWGVSFQRLAYDQVPKYMSAFHENFDPGRGLTMSWHSNLDEYLRLFNVESNGYIFEKSPMNQHLWDSLSPEQRIIQEHTSTQYDITRIKSSQELFSSEGFLATLFYQINTNLKIQSQYADSDFYYRFLLSQDEDSIDPKEIFSPLENVLLKNLAVWEHMNNSDSMDPITIAFLKGWISLFPDDAREVGKILITLSRGGTVSIDLPRLVEKANYYGQIGDIQKFRFYSGQYFNELIAIIDQIEDNPAVLFKVVGPEIWISHPTLKIRRTLWMPEPTSPLVINLNTAGLADLASFIGKQDAAQFIEQRRIKGYFNSLSEINELGYHFN